MQTSSNYQPTIGTNVASRARATIFNSYNSWSQNTLWYNYFEDDNTTFFHSFIDIVTICVSTNHLLTWSCSIKCKRQTQRENRQRKEISITKYLCSLSYRLNKLIILEYVAKKNNTFEQTTWFQWLGTELGQCCRISKQIVVCVVFDKDVAVITYYLHCVCSWKLGAFLVFLWFLWSMTSTELLTKQIVLFVTVMLF